MFDSIRKAALTAAIAIGAMGAATAAQARDGYYDRYRDRDNDAAIAIGAGVIGLAVGAAIASDRRDGYWRDRRFYRGYPRGYYGRPYPRRFYNAYPRGYYRDDRWRGGWGGGWGGGWRDDWRYRRGWYGY